MCTQEQDSINVPRCGVCTTTLFGDLKAEYNYRKGYWMCGNCVITSKERLLAYLTRNKEK